MTEQKELLRLSEVSRRIGIRATSINYWVLRGSLKPVIQHPVKLYDVNQVRAFMETYYRPRTRA
jgi:MerR HTH family regulatory protein